MAIRKNAPAVPTVASQVMLLLRPRALRPPAAAAYLGCTPFAIEEGWRNGSLKYRIIGGQRVSTPEQLDEWFETHAEQSGALPGRGIYAVKKKAA